MKFWNGCWLQKEGIGCFAPKEAYFVKCSDTDVTICAPTTKIVKRGDTLGGINLTVRISTPAEEVIRVQVSHHLGVQKKAPVFDLNLDENRPADIEETEQEVIVRSGSLSLRINKKMGSMRYERNGRLMTQSSQRDLAYMRTGWTGEAYDMDPEGKAFMRQQLELSVNEHVYGLGERFGALVKNGQSIDIWNEDRNRFLKWNFLYRVKRWTIF